MSKKTNKCRQFLWKPRAPKHKTYLSAVREFAAPSLDYTTFPVLFIADLAPAGMISTSASSSRLFLLRSLLQGKTEIVGAEWKRRRTKPPCLIIHANTSAIAESSENVCRWSRQLQVVAVNMERGEGWQPAAADELCASNAGFWAHTRCSGCQLAKPFRTTGERLQRCCQALSGAAAVCYRTGADWIGAVSWVVAVLVERLAGRFLFLFLFRE